MTTIHGHSVVIQQSGAVSEVIHGTNSPKPNPEQTELLQNQTVAERGTTVQEFDEAERLKQKKEAARQRRERERERKKKKKEPALERKKPEEQDPDAPGRILDTII